MIEIIPLEDKVLLEVEEAPMESDGGIALPDSCKKEPEQGKVVAVGPGRLLNTGVRAEMTVQVGDTVVFAKFTTSPVTIEDKEYHLIEEYNLLAVLRKK